MKGYNKKLVTGAFVSFLGIGTLVSAFYKQEVLQPPARTRECTLLEETIDAYNSLNAASEVAYEVPAALLEERDGLCTSATLKYLEESEADNSRIWFRTAGGILMAYAGLIIGASATKR